MRLVRYGPSGSEKPGLLDESGHIRDLSNIVPDIAGTTLCSERLEELRMLAPESLPNMGPAETVRLGPCVSSVGKVIGVAINYRLHGVETGLSQPAEPALFLKATSAISGPYDPLELPHGGEKTDWEVELGVVIGTRAKNVTVEDAMWHVAGYCIVNDVSERHFQLECGSLQHSKGKSADTFCPLGPWLVTQDEIQDPQALRLQTILNGTTMQDGTTADMTFTVARLISYISRFMSLHPGDIISTGTPDGVGRGRNPPIYLKAGDIIEQRIDKLGHQKHEVINSQS